MIPKADVTNVAKNKELLISNSVHVDEVTNERPTRHIFTYYVDVKYILRLKLFM